MSVNTLCWTDIPVNDLDRATKFYSAVLGQEVSKMSEAGFEYGLLPHEEQNASGCLCVGADSVGSKNTPSQTGPLVYLSVEGRLDDAIKAALDLLQDLGGLARFDERGGKQFIYGRNGCPLAAVTASHPEACLIVESLLSKVIGVPAKKCCEYGETPRCCFELARK